MDGGVNYPNTLQGKRNVSCKCYFGQNKGSHCVKHWRCKGNEATYCSDRAQDPFRLPSLASMAVASAGVAGRMTYCSLDQELASMASAAFATSDMSASWSLSAPRSSAADMACSGTEIPRRLPHTLVSLHSCEQEERSVLRFKTLSYAWLRKLSTYLKPTVTMQLQ